ncbi:hypothetical protein GCM10009107_38880 [Ideonella azotifigens]|uniref:Uncharacterized protein n=1 Tax=Ideonella azotifigens TaxID=513160 RepID=A0ABN1K8S5_9BURK
MAAPPTNESESAAMASDRTERTDLNFMKIFLRGSQMRVVKLRAHAGGAAVHKLQLAV